MAKAPTYSNPPFDPRIMSLPGPAGVTRLYRGYLVSSPDGALTTLQKSRWKCRFLYNPSTIEVSHATTSDMLTPEDRDKFDLSTYEGDTASMLTWSLLFDRTYETWDESYKNKVQGKYGVYSDVRALYGMVGMVSPSTFDSFELIRGPMTVQPVQVYFGEKARLTYYGRIESLAITYTHWTTRMIPNRCVVSITLKIYPKNISRVVDAARPSAFNSDATNGTSRGGSTPSRRPRTLPADHRTGGPDVGRSAPSSDPSGNLAWTGP